MDPPQRPPARAQLPAHRHDHRRRPAQEVVVRPRALRQAPVQQRRVDAAALAKPVLRRLLEYVDHRQVQPAAQLFDLVAQDQVVPGARAQQQPVRPPVAAVGQRPQDAQHRRHPHPAGDQHESRRRVQPLHGEPAVGPVEEHPPPRPQPAQQLAEVAQRLDRELLAVRGLRGRGDRERVLLEHERRGADLQPGELPGLEPSPLVSVRPQHEAYGVARDGLHLLHDVRPAQRTPRQPQPAAEPHAEHHQAEQPEPDGEDRTVAELVQPPHVQPAADHHHDGEEQVSHPPRLVARAPAPSTQRQQHRAQHRHGGRDRRARRGAGVPDVEDGPAARVLVDHQAEVHEHQQHRSHCDQPVHQQHVLDAERRHQRRHPRHQHQRDHHQREGEQAGVGGGGADRPGRRVASEHPRERERKGDQQQISGEPGDPRRPSSTTVHELVSTPPDRRHREVPRNRVGVADHTDRRLAPSGSGLHMAKAPHSIRVRGLLFRPPAMCRPSRRTARSTTPSRAVPEGDPSGLTEPSGRSTSRACRSVCAAQSTGTRATRQGTLVIPAATPRSGSASRRPARRSWRPAPARRRPSPSAYR